MGWLRPFLGPFPLPRPSSFPAVHGEIPTASPNNLYYYALCPIPQFFLMDFLCPLPFYRLGGDSAVFSSLLPPAGGWLPPVNTGRILNHPVGSPLTGRKISTHFSPLRAQAHPLTRAEVFPGFSRHGCSGGGPGNWKQLAGVAWGHYNVFCLGKNT